MHIDKMTKFANTVKIQAPIHQIADEFKLLYLNRKDSLAMMQLLTSELETALICACLANRPPGVCISDTDD